MKKKILLGLGAMISTVVPMVAVVGCDIDDERAAQTKENIIKRKEHKILNIKKFIEKEKRDINVIKIENSWYFNSSDGRTSDTNIYTDLYIDVKVTFLVKGKKLHRSKIKTFIVKDVNLDPSTMADWSSLNWYRY